MRFTGAQGQPNTQNRAPRSRRWVEPDGDWPASHVAPDGRDLNWTASGWSASRCAGGQQGPQGLRAARHRGCCRGAALLATIRIDPRQQLQLLPTPAAAANTCTCPPTRRVRHQHRGVLLRGAGHRHPPRALRAAADGAH